MRSANVMGPLQIDPDYSEDSDPYAWLRRLAIGFEMSDGRIVNGVISSAVHDYLHTYCWHVGRYAWAFLYSDDEDHAYIRDFWLKCADMEEEVLLSYVRRGRDAMEKDPKSEKPCRWRHKCCSCVTRHVACPARVKACITAKEAADEWSPGGPE